MSQAGGTEPFLPAVARRTAWVRVWVRVGRRPPGRRRSWVDLRTAGGGHGRELEGQARQALERNDKPACHRGGMTDAVGSEGMVGLVRAAGVGRGIVAHTVEDCQRDESMTIVTGIAEG